MVQLFIYLFILKKTWQNYQNASVKSFLIRFRIYGLNNLEVSKGPPNPIMNGRGAYLTVWDANKKLFERLMSQDN